MKRSKMTDVLSFAGMAFVLCGLVFSLSSKSDDIPIGDEPCETLAGDPARIRIAVDAFGSSANPFRNNNFQDYVPNNDLRLLDSDPAGFISEEDQYYCVVTVTSPQCADWVWEAALSNANRDGDVMDIIVPPDGFDTRINVVYYEVADFPVTPIDFNQAGLFGEQGIRVIYEATETFLGAPGLAGSPPEPIELFATDNDAQSIDICDFCDGDIDWGDGKGVAGNILEDYGSINTLIESRN